MENTPRSSSVRTLPMISRELCDATKVQIVLKKIQRPKVNSARAASHSQ